MMIYANALEQYAVEHHSTAAVFIADGWSVEKHLGRPALRFKTDSGPRWRFVDGKKPKYHHATTYKACWHRLKESAQVRFAFLIDCNGAASTVVARAAGLPAFSYQSGEGTNPPAERIAELKTLLDGRRVWVAFDCDKNGEGHRDAVKRVQLYRKNGIEAEAINLGLDLAGGDLADFIGLNRGKELTSLLKCKRLVIPDPEPPRKKYIPKDEHEADDLELAQLALNVLASWRRDSYREWVAIGMSLAELGDAGLTLWEQWSAGSDKYKPGQCAKKFKKFRGDKTLGSLFYYANEDFGPTWRPYKPPKDKADEYIGHGEPIKPTYPTCLPVAVRSALNAYAHPSIAPVLELWLEGIRIGLLEPGEAATVDCLIHIAKVSERHVTTCTIRRGIQNMTDPHGAVFLHVLQDLISLQEEKTPESLGPCKRKGRIPGVYQLIPWSDILDCIGQLVVVPILQKVFPKDDPLVAPIRAEFLSGLVGDDVNAVAAQLNAKYGDLLAKQPGYRQAMNKARGEYKRLRARLNNPTYAEIPKNWTYKNSTEYVACCARAVIEAAGGSTQYSHKELVEFIGCSVRNLKTVLKRAGIWITDIDTTVDKPVRNVSEIKSGKWDKAMRGWPAAVVSSLNSAPYPLGKQGVYVWAESELTKGATVSVRYQQAYRQGVDTVDQPRKAKPRLLCTSVAFITRLLNWLLRLLTAEEAFAARTEPIARVPVTPWQRLAKQLRIAALIALLVVAPGKSAKETYGEVQLRKLLVIATPHPTGAPDPTTGEIVPHSVQMTLSLLLEDHANPDVRLSTVPESHLQPESER